MERRDLRTNGGKIAVDGFCMPGGGSSHLTVIDCSVELLLPQLPMPSPTPAELVQYGANVGRAGGRGKGKAFRRSILLSGGVVVVVVVMAKGGTLPARELSRSRFFRRADKREERPP